MKKLVILLLVIFNSFHTVLRCSHCAKNVFFKFGIKIEYIKYCYRKSKMNMNILLRWMFVLCGGGKYRQLGVDVNFLIVWEVCFHAYCLFL